MKSLERWLKLALPIIMLFTLIHEINQAVQGDLTPLSSWAQGSLMGMLVIWTWNS